LGSVRNIFSQITVPTCSHSGEQNQAPRSYRPPQGKGCGLRQVISRVIYQALVSVGVPENDCFQVVGSIATRPSGSRDKLWSEAQRLEH
jgi:hypothetical protein